MKTIRNISLAALVCIALILLVCVPQEGMQHWGWALLATKLAGAALLFAASKLFTKWETSL